MGFSTSTAAQRLLLRNEAFKLAALAQPWAQTGAAPGATESAALGVQISALAAAIAAVTVSRIKAVTQYNSINKDTDPVAGQGSYSKYALRQAHVIGGGPIVEFDPFFYNWIMKDSRNGLCTNPGGSLTVDGAAIEYNGISVPVTFGGLRALTMADGAAGVFADPIPATAFNVAQIPLGAKVYIKLRVTVPTGGALPFSSRLTASSSDMQSWLYIPGSTTAGSVDAVGSMTYTGNVPEPRVYSYAPLMLGRHANANAVCVLGCGDSIGAGFGDTQLDSIGYGYIQRLINASGSAGLNLCVPGSRAIDGMLDTRFTNLYQYGTHGIINYGTNNPESASAIVDLIKQRVAQFQAAGIARTLVAKRLPNTTSTDSWATVANQTADAGVSTVIANLNAAIDAAGFYGVLNGNSVRDTTTPTKWKAGSITADGLHPGGADNVTNGYLFLANEATPQFNAMIAA